MPIYKPLLHPKRVSLNRLEPWVDLIDRLRTGSYDHIGEPIDQLLAEAPSGKPLIYVGDPEKEYALQIRGAAWSGSLGAALDARTSVTLGWLVVDERAFPLNSLERRLAYQPLYYSPGSLPKWAAQRPPSVESLRRVTREIAGEFKESGLVPTEDEFVAELVGRTGCSGRQ